MQKEDKSRTCLTEKEKAIVRIYLTEGMMHYRHLSRINFAEAEICKTCGHMTYSQKIEMPSTKDEYLQILDKLGLRNGKATIQ